MHETIVFFSIIGSGLLLWFLLTRERPARYRRKPVLTGGGLEFFYRLKRALPECLVCPHVAASALIEPMGIGKARQVAVTLLVGKSVGYAVFDEELKLLAVVELDHRPRLTRREAARDAWFASAGIKTVRFQTKHLPSEAKILSSIYPRSNTGSAPYAMGGDRRVEPIEFQRPQTPWHNTENGHL
jgi:hypothetical protein